MNRTIKQMIGVLSALWLLAACQEDTLSGGVPSGDGVLRLSGVNAQQIQVDTRADEVKGFFLPDTHYRILMEGDTDGGGVQYEPELRFSDVGRDVVSGSQHFIQLLEKQGNLVFDGEEDVVNFYGLTDPALQVPEGSTGYQEFVTDYLPVGEDFLYRLEAPVEGGKYTLPDLRSAVSTGNSLGQLSYVIPLHFKHILSKVNFEIVQQREEGTDEGLFGHLSLEGLSVSGQPTAGTFHLKENRFTTLEGAVNYPVSLKEGATSIPITITPKAVGSILLFPMTAETLDKEHMLKVDVTLGGDVETLKQFDKSGANVQDKGNGKGRLTLTCPVYANNPAEGGDGTTPLRLLPNHEYDLQFVIMSNEVRIITIVPRVYEWLDGETDAHSDEDGYYEEQDLGQPITFNGVVWSDRNLGASSAHPLRSVEDWMEAVGYYYQFNRNIPYFPNSLEEGKVNLHTPLDIAFTEKPADPKETDQEANEGYLKGKKRKLYPVVNYTAWGTDVSYPAVDQIRPINGNAGDKTYISRVGEWNADAPDKNVWGFVTHTHRGEAGLWSQKKITPCPKGWRLPTKEDFMGILPGTILSGNMTFLVVNGRNGNGGWGPPAGANKNPTEDYFGWFTTGGEGMKLRSTNLPGTLDWEGNSVTEQLAYLGEFPCLFRCEDNDPADGRKSQYVLSMYGDDWIPVMDGSNKYRSEGFVFNWGVVYGIKNVGTPQAYRVKWEIQLVGDYTDGGVLTKEVYEGRRARKYNNGLYGVLVISRYPGTATDRFRPDANGSYQWVAADKQWWSNPVEVMYLPLCGVGGKWNLGYLYNVGTETWYATSEEGRNGNEKGMVWLKIGGGNSENQGLFYNDWSPKVDLVNIRPVRDN